MYNIYETPRLHTGVKTIYHLLSQVKVSCLKAALLNTEHLVEVFGFIRCYATNSPLLRIFLRNGLFVFNSSLWELDNFHVFIVAEVCVPIATVAQR
jgi:hypothetical protein